MQLGAEVKLHNYYISEVEITNDVDSQVRLAKW